MVESTKNISDDVIRDDVAGGSRVKLGDSRYSGVRVVSAKVGFFSRIKEIISRRELLVFMVRKELSVRYRSSVMGLLWSMFNPALMLAVWYFVFQIVLKTTIPYFAIYLMSGLVAWNFFLGSVMTSTTAVVENAAIVKKVAFPREVLALSKVGQSMVFFVFQLGVLLLAMLLAGSLPAFSLLWLLILALIDLVLFTSAISIFVSCLNVFYRDVQHFVEILTFAWFFGAPIVYSFSISLSNSLSKHHLTWLYLSDPMTPIIMTFQRVLYAKVSPHTIHGIVRVLPNYSPVWYLGVLALVFVASLTLFLLSLLLFGRLEANFAEEL